MGIPRARCGSRPGRRHRRPRGLDARSLRSASRLHPATDMNSVRGSDSNRPRASSGQRQEGVVLPLQERPAEAFEWSTGFGSPYSNITRWPAACEYQVMNRLSKTKGRSKAERPFLCIERQPRNSRCSDIWTWRGTQSYASRAQAGRAGVEPLLMPLGLWRSCWWAKRECLHSEMRR